MRNDSIDKGVEFDWGRTSADYAKYRDIYPLKMYDEFLRLGFGAKGKLSLDIGTGTGVIPRFMADYGGELYGIDISANQVKKAIELSSELNINYTVGSAENIPFEDGFFDVVCAVQCWRYFDKEKAVSEIKRVLKTNGVLIIAYMQWLADESPIIEKSLSLVKKFNPLWDCFSERIEVVNSRFSIDGFRKKEFIEFDCDIPFTYESWNGRMKASRGIEATLSTEETENFSKEHLEMLKSLTKDNFTLKHQIAIFCFEKINKGERL